MQARSVDPAAETDRKVRRRCRRAKGRTEKRVSTETGITADAHRSIDPQPAKTGGGEQRAQVPTFQMPCSGRACRSGNELTNGSLGTIFLFSRAKAGRNFQQRLAKNLTGAAGLRWFELEFFATTCARGRGGSLRSCTGMACSDTASRRSAVRIGSRTADGNSVRSRCSDPVDSSAGSGQISRRHRPRRWFPNGSGSGGNAGDKCPPAP